MRNIIGFPVTIMAMICILEAEGAPLLRLPLPFLRGGSATNAAVVKTKTLTAKKQKKQRKPGPHPIQILGANAKRGLGGLGNKIQQDTSNLGKNIGREWGKLTSNTQKFVANIPKPPLLPRRRKSLKSCKKLDEVCHTFASVLRGNEVDTAQLLKACKAHLAFMKTGGSSLRLVAKDLEANVQKAERVYKKSPKEGKSLSSLLACEKSRGIHNGDELHEKSAAMGLLWIRRSLKFQLDLYSSIISAEQHPREAAYGAYDKHLSPFHGWALRKVFPASLSQMPGRDVFIAKFAGISEEELNDEYDREIARKLKALVSAWDPLISCWEEEFERLGLEDTRRV
mmetsp:Transcript_8826/g.19041  ORF Transcript_8826/g.19041 Transcript_8826/m.19041 type:complete len:340 (+) Transcript_8826:347-1366(+)